MRLEIAAIPPIVIEPVEAGPLRAALNGEIPNLSVSADNGRGQWSEVLAVPPLRASAVLWADDVVLFAGSVQAVGLGPSVTVDLEA